MADISIGIVGLDTSHCKAFTEILNNPQNPYYVPGGRVTCAYPGGTEVFSLSRDRVKGYTNDLKNDYGLEMVASIEQLISQVDAVLLESVDGRQHLEQFRSLAAGKPVYIDKPLACSSKDAEEIVRIAKESNTQLMSCSSLRYATGILNLADAGEPVTSCEAFGPAPLLDDYPGLFWYGIHSAEVLFSFMGAGCKHVQLLEKPEMDIIVGDWEDGRTGIVRGTRLETRDFGCVVHTSAGTGMGIAQSSPPYYAVMLKEVMRFFQTGESPIPVSETMEIIAFLESAEISRAENGKRIALNI